MWPVLAPPLLRNVAVMDMETATQSSKPSLCSCALLLVLWSMCPSAVQSILMTPIVFVIPVGSPQPHLFLGSNMSDRASLSSLSEAATPLGLGS